MCRGGPHFLQSLYGRAYNLGTAAYVLCTLGLYDEALNLIRGIGEIGNIIALSVVDKGAMTDWLTSDSKVRRTRFSPAKVGKLLEAKGGALMCADSDWYSELCENFTHVNPATRPNLHGKAGRAHVGGIFQEQGLTRAIDELAGVLGVMGLQICKYSSFDDLFDLLKAQAKEVHSKHWES